MLFMYVYVFVFGQCKLTARALARAHFVGGLQAYIFGGIRKQATEVSRSICWAPHNTTLQEAYGSEEHHQPYL